MKSCAADVLWGDLFPNLTSFQSQDLFEFNRSMISEISRSEYSRLAELVSSSCYSFDFLKQNVQNSIVDIPCSRRDFGTHVWGLGAFLGGLEGAGPHLGVHVGSLGGNCWLIFIRSTWTPSLKKSTKLYRKFLNQTLRWP